MARVVLSKLCKTYTGSGRERVEAVREASLEVGDGELFVLMGASGGGKTTLLRLIAGLEVADSGSVVLDNTDITREPPESRDVAMVFQNPALYPHMTVFENLAFGLKLRKVSRIEIDRRVAETAETLEFRELLRCYPGVLSSGQKQRVALGRAIVRSPRVYLFDEPLSNLDAEQRSRMRLEIRRLQKRLGATMIFVTHDQGEAMCLGDRIAVMQSGRIEQVADPARLYQSPANLAVAGTIGSSVMNLLPGWVVAGDGAVWFEAGPGGDPSDGAFLRFQLHAGWGAIVTGGLSREVILGLRPEDIRVEPWESGETDNHKSLAVVDDVEPGGAETVLHLRAGGVSFTAPVRNESFVAVGGWVRFHFDLRRAHLFDPITGRRIADSAESLKN